MNKKFNLDNSTMRIICPNCKSTNTSEQLVHNDPVNNYEPIKARGVRIFRLVCLILFIPLLLSLLSQLLRNPSILISISGLLIILFGSILLLCIFFSSRYIKYYESNFHDCIVCKDCGSVIPKD